MALYFFGNPKGRWYLKKFIPIRNTKKNKTRTDISCARCNKLLNSQKSTIKIVSIISCQQAMKEPLLKPSLKMSRRMDKKIFADLQLKAVVRVRVREREIVRFCNGYDWAVSVVFCSLQSLKIHLMLPPYAINYHFCLTLFGSFCSGRTEQSRPQLFFSLLFLICHGLLFSHSFIVVVVCSVCVCLCMRWSPVDSQRCAN